MKTTKTSYLFSLALLVVFTQSAWSQTNPQPSNEVKDFLTRKQPFEQQRFFEQTFNDFSKLLATDFSTGKPLSYASFEVAKPSAEVSYAIRPFAKWKYLKNSFINLGLQGGFNDGVIGLISGQKPSKSYAANLSFSFLFKSLYKYTDTDNYTLKAKIVNRYNEMVLSNEEKQLASTLAEQKKLLAKKLNDLYELLKSAEKNGTETVNLKDSIYANMQNYQALVKKTDLLTATVEKKKKIADSVYNQFNFSSKHLFWMTVTQKANGNKFRYYDIVNPQNTLQNSKKTSNGFETTATINYFYKSSAPAGLGYIFNNMLLTGSISAGYFNNFDELSSTEFKKVTQTDVSNTSYTNTEVANVYDITDFKAYHGTKVFVEGYKMFTKSGTLGLRLKYIWDMPYGEPDNNTKRHAQQNLEAGMVFNALNTKSGGPAKINFEVFYAFNDLNGSNLSAANTGQKFYKRNQIGVKTSIPFNF